MNYYNACLCTLLMTLQLSFLQAQTKSADSQLDIGMPIPGMEAYRGKLLILDFWDVSCLPCIAAFPKMQELQDTFGDRIQILLVTTDSQEKVDKLKERSKIVQQVHLPMLVSDTSLFRHFPFASVPAHVWVGPEGIIRYMTNGQNTTKESIGTYLQGMDPKLPVKREQKDYDFDAPLLLEGGGRQLKRMLYYSILTTRMPTDFSQAGVLKEPDGTRTCVKAINTSILQLYQLAYGESATSVYKYDNRVVLQIKDPSRLQWPKDRTQEDTWKVNNTYAYEISVKPAFADRLFR
ncbi:Thiol-disulfide isomerase or thioredoxin [bacterium A37T11]|nr:Thiol-disulfide isomerase or thioredoxin [bacterium A37T11]